MKMGAGGRRLNKDYCGESRKEKVTPDVSRSLSFEVERVKACSRITIFFLEAFANTR